MNRPVDALLPESFAAKRFARLLGDGGEPLRDECERLLAICGSGDFLSELEAPLGKLADLLSTVVDVLDGRAEQASGPCDGGCSDAGRRIPRGGGAGRRGLAGAAMSPQEVLLAAWRLAAEIRPVGEGLIHDTFLAQGDGDPLVLQKVNGSVFRDTDLLMENGCPTTFPESSAPGRPPWFRPPQAGPLPGWPAKHGACGPICREPAR